MTDATTETPGSDLEPDAGGEPPHRRVNWKHALWVSVVAFLVWMLIDAPTLQHNAQVSPVGTRRTVALDILGPIATVSRWTQLSHIVSIGDGLLGRHGNQPGNGSALVTEGPQGPHGHGPGPATTVPPTGPSPVPVSTTTAPPSAAAPLRVLIVGDSLGIDVGDALENDLANTGVVLATLDGQVGTGLTRPDYYNWPAELHSDLDKYNPQVVVIMVGANDAQDFPGPPDVPYGSAAWTATYTQRVASFMSEATSTGAHLIWIGMPPMENPGLSADMSTLDGIYQAQATQTPNVTYLPSGSVIAPNGFTAYLDVGGNEVNVREPDGTHIAPGGAELVSQDVISTMRQQLHIQLP